MSTYLVDFPRLGEGFLAEVHSNGWHLRLAVALEIEGWTWSVVDLGEQKYGFPKQTWAKDADDAKGRAEEYARNTLGVIGRIDWANGPPPIQS